MVVDAHGGGWGPAAKEAFKTIAREHANQTGTSVSMATSELAQRISITLERENARAILRRLTPVGPLDPGCNAAAWIDDLTDLDDTVNVVMSSFQYAQLTSNTAKKVA
mgnify:CR=1 FL=1